MDKKLDPRDSDRSKNKYNPNERNSSSGDRSKNKYNPTERNSSSGDRPKYSSSGDRPKYSSGDRSKPKSSYEDRSKGKNYTADSSKSKYTDVKVTAYKGKPLDQKNKKTIFSRDERKEIRRQRKAAKPNAEQAGKMTQIFGQSMDEMTHAERLEAAASVVEAASGKILELCRRHDTARALQLVFKFGDKALRERAFQEIKPCINDLVKHKSGHFVILALAKHYPDCHAEMIANFKGHVRNFSTTKDGAQILDFLFASAPPQQQYLILRELLDPAFGVFGQDAITQIDSNLHLQKEHQNELKKRALNDMMQWVPNIHEIAEMTAEQIQAKPQNLLAWLVARDPTNRCVFFDKVELLLQRALDKDCLMFRFFHPILQQYLHVVPMTISSKRHLMQQLARVPLNLFHSKEGAQSVFYLLNYLPLKERKVVVKFVKGRILELALSETGYLIILGLLHTIDDTVFVKKTVLNELFSNAASSSPTSVGQAPALIQLITSQSGMKIFNYIFNTHLNIEGQKYFSPAYYTPQEIELFKPCFVPQYLLEQDSKKSKDDDKEKVEDAAAGVALDENGQPKKEVLNDREFSELMKDNEEIRLQQKSEEVKAKNGVDMTPTPTCRKPYFDKCFDLGLIFAPQLLTLLETVTPQQLFGFSEQGNMSRTNVGLIQESDSDSDSDSDSNSDSDDEDAEDEDAEEAEMVELEAPKTAHQQQQQTIAEQQKSLQFLDKLKELPTQKASLEALTKHRVALDVLFEFFCSLSMRGTSIQANQAPESSTVPNLVATHAKYVPQYNKFLPQLDALLTTMAKLTEHMSKHTTISNYDSSITKAQYKSAKKKEDITPLLFTTPQGLEFANPDHILANGKSHLLFKRFCSDSTHDKFTPEDKFNFFNIVGLAPAQRQLFTQQIFESLKAFSKTKPGFFKDLTQTNRFAWVATALAYYNVDLFDSVVKFLKPFYPVINGKPDNPGVGVLRSVFNGQRFLNSTRQKDGSSKSLPVVEERKEVPAPAAKRKSASRAKDMDDDEEQETKPAPVKKNRSASRK